MSEREIIEAELKSVEEHKAEVNDKLKELTQHLGRMNLLHNIYSKELKEMKELSVPVGNSYSSSTEKNSSES